MTTVMGFSKCHSPILWFMRYLILSIVTLLFLQAAPVFADPPDNYPFLSYDEGLRQAQADKKLIFIHCGRSQQE